MIGRRTTLLGIAVASIGCHNTGIRAVASFTGKVLATTTVKRTASTTTTNNMVVSKITGMPAGPYPVGVTTVQFDDMNRADPGNHKRKRGLQTEIWYPAVDEASNMARTKYSNYLGVRGCGASKVAEAIKVANGPNAIGGYREGISIEELDDPERTTWLTDAVRDATPREDTNTWPLVLFSHGSGAYRASYSYWTEFLASHGFVVAACDHPGSARYTVVDGEVIVPGGARSKRASMELERCKDMITVLDGMERLSKTDSRFAGRVDCNNAAMTGMSFGGYTTAAVLEMNDPRIKAAVMKCPSIGGSGTSAYPNKPLLHIERSNRNTPVMVMLGGEDTVIGESGNDAARKYVDGHDGENSYLFEIVRGGHVSFTSCEMFDPDYGNGIAATKSCPSLTTAGSGYYKPLDIVQQHAMINSYGLAFLNTYLRTKEKHDNYNQSYLNDNHFVDSGELVYRRGKK